MTAWTSDEVHKIGRAEELQISSYSSDGTVRKSTTVWVVSVGDDLYVRSVNGRTSAWFRGTLVRHEGHIRAGGADRDVSFVEEAAPEINRKIDAAYRDKYRRYAANIVNSVLTPQARAATLKIVPR